MLSLLPRHADWVRSSLASPALAAFPIRVDRSARASSFSRLAQRLLTLRPAHSPSHLVTLYTRGFSHFVTSMTAPIASGWSDSCRVGFVPTEERHLSTAHTPGGRLLRTKPARRHWGSVARESGRGTHDPSGHNHLNGMSIRASGLWVSRYSRITKVCRLEPVLAFSHRLSWSKYRRENYSLSRTKSYARSTFATRIA